MLIRKQGYPERSDLVICTVAKIQFNSIFVTLDEYERRQGIIHISEISPGRIRNIRDYVKEGKVIVCVVLRVSEERDLIELSLRRVAESQRRAKINEMKQEQKAMKIVEFIAKTQELDGRKMMEDIIKAVTPDYPTVHSYFEEVVMGGATLDLLKLPKKVADALDETLRQRIKPPEVIIKGRFVLHSYQPEGVEIIKQALEKAQAVGKESLSIVYQGAGKYDLSIKSEDYKSAEKVLEKIEAEVGTFMQKNKSECLFSRTDK
jgi:translation initiation factor 2 subunit 1